jgi:hypothetical protein
MMLALAGGLFVATALRAQDEPPPVPKGVEVMARGPVHEAFATPTSEPVATPSIPKRPPKPLEEMPPEQKPDGEVIWVPGYWAWDDDRKDFLWVSGIWRTPPPGKQWVAGYWRDSDDGGAQWVPGFWTQAAQAQAQEQDVNYLPEPPKPPVVAPPGERPTVDAVWRAGYWGRVQPGYVWVAGHYRWTPSGYIYIPGYWDLAIATRGVLFAPVVVDPVVVGVGFVYTPAYCVTDTVVLDALFVRPCYCHYYFGDYYGPAYVGLGYESCVVYSRGHYDSIVVYSTWEHREDPAWLSVQIDLSSRRDRGLDPAPPRTLIQQNTIINQTVINNQTTIINNRTALVPASRMAAAKGGAIRTVKLEPQARAQIHQQARAAVEHVAAQRQLTEKPVPGGRITQPHAAKLNVSKAAALSSPASRSPGTAGAARGGQAPGAPGHPGTHPQTGMPAGQHPAGNPAGQHPYGTVPGQHPTGPGYPGAPGRSGVPGHPPQPPQRTPPRPPPKQSDPHSRQNDR